MGDCVILQEDKDFGKSDGSLNVSKRCEGQVDLERLDWSQGGE